MTGAQSIAQARIYAQDADTLNYGVSDAEALALLNDVCLNMQGRSSSRRVYMAASTSGATFPAGTATVLLPLTADIETILDAYQSADSTVAQPTGRSLRKDDVEDMKAMLDAEDDGSFESDTSATDFQCWAAEPVLTGSSVWRLYVYPRLAVDKHLTLEVNTSNVLSASGDSLPFTRYEAMHATRFLAAEIARLNKRPRAFIEDILAPLPSDVMSRFKSGGRSKGQARIRDSEEHD